MSSFLGLSGTDQLEMFGGNGKQWEKMTISYSAGASCNGATKCVRDPDGTYFGSKYIILYTCADALSNVHQFCMTTTTDPFSGCVGSLGTCTFTSTQFVDTTSLSGSLSNWNPNWARNPDGTKYLDGSGCPSVTFVGTNGTTSFKLYETHPTNNCSDPSTVGTTWSTPVQLVVDTETQTYLDGTVTCISPAGGNCTGTGDTFYLWYIHLVLSTTQFVQYATSSTMTGSYTRQSAGGDWLGLGLTNEEGPNLICADIPFVTSCSNWRLYFDNVGAAVGNLTSGQLNYTNCTSGCGTQSFSAGTWSATASIQTIDQAKHGAVVPSP